MDGRFPSNVHHNLNTHYSLLTTHHREEPELGLAPYAMGLESGERLGASIPHLGQSMRSNGRRTPVTTR